MKITLFSLLAVVFLAAIGFLAADIICGKERYLECSVTEHRYVAPWTETVVSSDTEGGGVSVDMINHPEEFHLDCQESEEVGSMDIRVDPDAYQRLTNGQPVTVRTYQGKWTSIYHFPAIVD